MKLSIWFVSALKMRNMLNKNHAKRSSIWKTKRKQCVMPNMICAVKFKKRFDDRLISDTNMFNKLKQKEKENQLPITMFLKKKTSRQLLSKTSNISVSLSSALVSVNTNKEGLTEYSDDCDTWEWIKLKIMKCENFQHI